MSIYKSVARLILASGSPRRKELLSSVGISFEIHASNIEEVHAANETPHEMVYRLAGEKARAVAENYPAAFVLAVDTDVFFKGQVLGKPSSIAEAETMIAKLSGETHTVLTVACLINIEQAVEHFISSETKVTFRKLSTAEIAAYVRSENVLDKAGAYGAQQLGLSLIEHIEGSFSAVIGLDLAKTIAMLLQNGAIKTNGA